MLTRVPLDSWLVSTLSPDGKQLATGTAEGAVRVFDVATQRLERVLLGHQSFVAELVWSRDGNWLASGGGADNTVRLWNMTTGMAGPVLAGHHGGPWISKIAWSADGRKLASCGFWGDYTIRIWDLQDGNDQVIHFGEGLQREMAWSPDGKTLATAGDATIYLWPTEGGGEPKQLAGHTGYVSCISFSPDGKWLLTASDDRSVRLWDTVTWTTEKVLSDFTNYVTTVAWRRDSQTIAVGQQDGFFKQVHIPDGNETWRSPQTHPIEQVVWSADESQLLGIDVRKNLQVWQASGEAGPVQHWSRSKKCQAFSPDGKRLAFATHDDKVEVWDDNARQLTEYTPFIGQVSRLTWNRASDRILITGFEPVGRIWNLDDNASSVRLSGLRSATCVAAWSADGTRMVTGSSDKSLRLWTAAGKLLWAWENQVQVPVALDWQPNGPWLAVGCDHDHTVRLWNVETHEAGPIIKVEHPVSDLKWSHDGTHLAICDVLVQIWQADGTHGPLLYRQGVNFLSVAWSLDDRSLLATEGLPDQGIARDLLIWHIEDDLVTTIAQPDAMLASLCWGDDGRQIICACSDSSIRSWNIATGRRAETTLLLEDDESIKFSDAGEILAATPGAADQLVYVTQQSTGQFELLTPPQFHARQHPAISSAESKTDTANAAPEAVRIRPRDWIGQAEHWKLTDQEIVGSIGTAVFPSKRTFLCSRKTYRNFELSCRIKLTGVDSGIMIRSRYDDSSKSSLLGPQVNIAPEYWGDVWQITPGNSVLWKAAPTKRVNRVVKPYEFNDVLIRCVGKHLFIQINGLTTIDNDFPEMPATGVIGWELTPEAIAVTIRDVRLTELAEGEPGSPRSDTN